MNNLDYRVKKINEFYDSLKSKGYLVDPSIDMIVKVECANLARYDISNEIFDSTLELLGKRFDDVIEDYMKSVIEMMESVSRPLEFMVDDKITKGDEVLSLSNLPRQLGNVVTRSKKPLSLDLNK